MADQLWVVELDQETHQVTLRAEDVEPGVEQIQFLVSDPARNVNMATLEVVILRGGEAPVISPLPQLVLPAGGGEERLGLSSFVSDPDTPVDQIAWEVIAEAGIGARVENSRLFVLVPNGQSGTRKLQLKARDPQGNLAMAARIAAQAVRVTLVQQLPPLSLVAMSYLKSIPVSWI